MSKTRKALRTIVVLGLLGGLAAVGAFSAFSSQTDNPNNEISAGSVTLTDNDAGSALYQLTNMKPGVNTERCIAVTYTGSLPASVRMYRAAGTLGALAQHANIKVEVGSQATPSFADCSGFSPSSTLFDGALDAIATGWAGGYQANPADRSWDNGDRMVYRVTVSIDDTDLAQGLTTGQHTLRWEAQNQ